MHAAWNVPELVAGVFDNLEEEDTIRVVRVCRLFWDIAIPAVWKEVSYNRRTVTLFKQFPLEDTYEDVAGKVSILIEPLGRVANDYPP